MPSAANISTTPRTHAEELVRAIISSPPGSFHLARRASRRMALQRHKSGPLRPLCRRMPIFRIAAAPRCRTSTQGETGREAGPFHGDDKMAFIQRLGPVLLVAACAALSLGACGGSDDAPADASRTRPSARSRASTIPPPAGTYAWKGVPFAKPPVGALRWVAPVDPDAWTTTRATTAVRQCLRAVRADLRARREQHLRRDHRHDAQPGRRQRGLPLPQHLASRQQAGEPAGDRLHPRRQQRLRLHRGPGLRRRDAGADRERGRRHDQLPAGDLRLAQPAAAASRGPMRRTTRATSPCSTTSRRSSSSTATSPRSAATPATSPSWASRPARSTSTRC